MNRDKLYSYLGFASKSRNLVSGTNTCILMMNRKRLKLLILSEDLSDNTVKKMLNQSSKNNVKCLVFGNSDDLSRVTGKQGNGVFGITDQHFAEIINDEIEKIQSERKVF